MTRSRRPSARRSQSASGFVTVPLATAMTREQALAPGAADRQQDAAIWTDTPEHHEQVWKEREDARERYRRDPDW